MKKCTRILVVAVIACMLSACGNEAAQTQGAGSSSKGSAQSQELSVSNGSEQSQGTSDSEKSDQSQGTSDQEGSGQSQGTSDSEKSDQSQGTSDSQESQSQETSASQEPDDGKCTRTSNHVGDCELTPGDGSITVNLEVIKLEPGESNEIVLIFCESQKSDLSLESAEFQNEDFWEGFFYESETRTVKSTYMWDDDLQDVVEVTLKNNTTYYVYAKCYDESCEEGYHDYMYLGSCTTGTEDTQTPDAN